MPIIQNRRGNKSYEEDVAGDAKFIDWTEHTSEDVPLYDEFR